MSLLLEFISQKLLIYHGFVFWTIGIPHAENRIETCKVFAEYIDNVAKGNDFEGFKILNRLSDLHHGFGVLIAETDDTIKVFDHGRPFIKMGKCNTK